MKILSQLRKIENSQKQLFHNWINWIQKENMKLKNELQESDEETAQQFEKR